MSRTHSSRFEPTINVRELDCFYRDLRQSIIALEEAYRRGAGPEVLEKTDFEARFGTALLQSYRHLLRVPLRPDPEGRREETIYALLGQIRDELFGIDTWFHAEIEEPDPSVSPSPPDDPVADSTPRVDSRHRYRITHESDEPIILRLDQIVAARHWGIGFVFDDGQATDSLAEQLARQSVHHLGRDLVDLAKMLPRLLRARPGKYPPLVAPRSGRVVEQLTADILNEHGQHAWLSRLAEDYSQKTDLRVKYPGLERPRGARVQVALGASEASHQKKIAGIRNSDHFVIVSPWALASAVPQIGATPSEGDDATRLDGELIERFWACIPGLPSDAESLSFAIRKLLCEAVESPIQDPRGPLARVPEALREFIRVWVQGEAFRTTQALRHWEANEGRVVRKRDGRMSFRTLAAADHSPQVKDFMDAHPSGSTIRGRVCKVGTKHAWVELAEPLRGRVSKSELSWRPGNSVPSQFLALGEEREFIVVAPCPQVNPNAIDLSLRRLVDDPWRKEAIADLEVGQQYQGRVQRHVEFGVFVELQPDLVGLVHTSQLPADVVQTRTQVYPQGAAITICILNIDPRARRIALKLADS